MQVEQPIPPTYPGGENPYDFILQAQSRPPKKMLPGGGSRKQRALVVVTGILFFIILLMVVLSFISSRAAAPTKALEKIAQTQNEIIRVSTLGGKTSRDTVTLGFAETVSTTITSSQKQTIVYLKARHVKADPKFLALGANASTDASLKTADSAGRYDSELVSVLEDSLSAYKQELKTTYSQTSNASQRKLLQMLYNQAVLLTKNQPTSS